jgi:hypothetical protein
MMSSDKFRLRNRRHYPSLFLIPFLILVLIAWKLAPPDHFMEVVISVLIAVGGFVGFLYSQHLQETRLFKELFTEFNQRYDRLNAELNAIRNRPEAVDLEEGDTSLLLDYFNLCAEEYLFFRAGYIDVDVWRSWCRGMKEYDDDPEIHKLWKEEIELGSYYGFTLGLLQSPTPAN